MGIYLKNMRMPKSCMDCPFKGFDRAGERGNICTIDDSITLHAVLDGMDVKFVRMGDCPLVPVPPHGDLIDRDALMKSESPVKKMMMFGGQYVFAENEIKNAPIVIPAEEDE